MPVFIEDIVMGPAIKRQTCAKSCRSCLLRDKRIGRRRRLARCAALLRRGRTGRLFPDRGLGRKSFTHRHGAAERSASALSGYRTCPQK